MIKDKSYMSHTEAVRMYRALLEENRRLKERLRLEKTKKGRVREVNG